MSYCLGSFDGLELCSLYVQVTVTSLFYVQEIVTTLFCVK